ncbi:helix-turn-helix transcriptional regulator [Undibacterium parvum]|uniref:Transcriptional regulator n=1 Tax=Undibacterium parvum TaxID=401471 RepID=A0A3Q9BR81_9BURK|nr:metalloregulator ArsR/SmtB family transcription factor [Undibacterium parvum]AZP12170.1 transcriptional regulator [Undibacterium parvum]
MNTAERVLYLLKTRGPQTAQEIAESLELTSMGARRQLEAWQEKGILSCEDAAEKIGRPTRRWQLTAEGHARFPDRHGDLTVQIIAQVRSLFGEAGLEKLISAREQDTEALYVAALSKANNLKARVKALSTARNAEGYMAHMEIQDDGSLHLIEDHCPICAAAQSCQQFCRSELAVFQRVLGPQCSVERIEHLQAGARRCVYLVREK